MKKFKIKRCEEGLTLIEVLASIVILSIVLISFSSILLQSAKHTKYNEEKLTAVDIAEEVVGEMRKSNSTKISVEKYGDGHYQVISKRNKGPNGLTKATICVNTKESIGQKESPFITEVYIKEVEPITTVEEEGQCYEE